MLSGTQSNVPFGNVLRMDAKQDERWRRTRGTWDRLRWARMAAGYKRAKDFADYVGMKEGTYRAYERDPGQGSKSTELDPKHALQWARKLKVRWEWLLTNEGTPWEPSMYSMDMSPGKARLKKAVEKVPDSKAAAIAEAIEAILKIG